ncbi:MAG: fibronectin type III domain-containing protein [Bacteroidota bacterium]
MKTRIHGMFFYALGMLVLAQMSFSQTTLFPVVPKELRGNFSFERAGTHDANNIRTTFLNYGMVGDYPFDPINVDLSTFHSVEVPKGTGMNYSDGITPFVLAKITKSNSEFDWIMETGFRERQQKIIGTLRDMRFEPRPGYFQTDVSINRDRSPAMSHLSRTWPDEWIDKLNDITDPGWKGSWNGYFGKRVVADQESYFVVDDDEFRIPAFTPDSRDSSRRGLGLRIETRGFQWSNPQAGNVIFWHYDIANEGTTDYFDNIIFGLYMDSGVGGSAIGCDPLPESDDDNAFYDKSFGLNLVYTWDSYGHGKSLINNCGRTGYLGYAYLETPGKQEDGIDNDGDGIIDEKRDGNPGQNIIGQQNILNYVTANYDQAKFEIIYGPVTSRPAYKDSIWWTGDEDMDWSEKFHDTGADGIFGTNDAGENDGMPTQGETNFGETDLHESDQIGLTGFKINRIAPGKSNPGGETDGIVFWNDPGSQKFWPKELYEQFTGDNGKDPFGPALALDYNIGFLFASGTFKLPAGSRERFSLALAYGNDLFDLRKTVSVVQQIYNANYQFATPPPRPTLHAESGDGYVNLSWNDVAERSIDPISYENDFEGYRIYRATDPEFRDIKVITNAQGTGPMVFGRPLVQFDLIDDIQGYSNLSVDGVQYFLGNETGIRHNYRDTTVINGQTYYYAIVAYDYGSDSLGFYPSENAVSVSRTVRGGIILPPNAVEVRPEPKVSGFVPAQASSVVHVKGNGRGSVDLEIVNSNLVPDNRSLLLRFKNTDPTNIRSDYYELVDSASGTVYIDRGTDLTGAGNGQVGAGVKPIVKTQLLPTIDTAGTGLLPGSASNLRFKVLFEGTTFVKAEKKRPVYPNDIRIEFSNSIVDTSFRFNPGSLRNRPSKFRVYAVKDDGSLMKLRYTFYDSDADSTLSAHTEFISILDTSTQQNVPGLPDVIWTITVDTTGQFLIGPVVKPQSGDLFVLNLDLPFSADDEFSFNTTAQRIDANKAKTDFAQQPYVVPNPYVGAASFEPEKFAISGRGERRLEFRGLPKNSVIRIYTVKGDLVQTLRHDGSNDGFVAWNLRTKDNMDVAPGLYIFHVDGNNTGTFIGKFAIIK